jgi:hypothetical protein
MQLLPSVSGNGGSRLRFWQRREGVLADCDMAEPDGTFTQGGQPIELFERGFERAGSCSPR